MFKKWILTLFSVSLFLPLNSAEDFVCVTIPKSGSHLIAKCLRAITKQQSIHIHNNNMNKVDECKDRTDSFLWTHFHHEDAFEALLALPEKKWIFNVRDLRDVLWARLNECLRENRCPFMERKDLHGQWLALPTHEKISALLSPWEWGNNLFLRGCFGVRNSHRFFSLPNVYVIQFEKLVGPEGGGDEETQVQEIKNIAAFLEVDLTEKDAITIARSLFGGTRTFRKGQIGEWKENLDDGNKMLFKLMLGDALIQLGYEKDYNW